MHINKYLVLSGFVVFLIFCLVGSVFAERVILNSGKIIEGKILERADTFIRIEIQGVPVTVFSDEIRSISSGRIRRIPIPEVSEEGQKETTTENQGMAEAVKKNEDNSGAQQRESTIGPVAEGQAGLETEKPLALSIDYPADGSEYKKGSTVDIKVSASEDVQTLLLASSIGKYQTLDERPFEFKFEIPKRLYTGNIVINVIGRSQDNKQISQLINLKIKD